MYTVWDVLNTIGYEIFSSYIVYPVFSCLFGIMPDPLEGLIETLCIEIKYSNRSILLTSVYRPPNNDSDSIQH